MVNFLDKCSGGVTTRRPVRRIGAKKGENAIRRDTYALVATMLAAGVASPGLASNPVTNGGFEQLSKGPNLGSNLTTATDWIVSSPGGTYSGQGYSIFFAAGAADNGGATDNNPINVGIWGPGKSEANGFTGSSPTGGNFFASDSDPAYASNLADADRPDRRP